ncbi:nuclear transport factor 2 family protein [Actinomadura sp. SCN-SB]|uniref:nuclear transport factor 2 family protein n=1 Tax=Actinomadura sp. SCN-SB TaxID=3373092 RepID=UPI0037519077
MIDVLNELMPHELTQHVFQTVDSARPGSIAELFTEDATMVFGNADPLVGREAITAGIQGFFATINGLQHRIINDWHIGTDTGADTIAETEVTYHRLDDKYVSVPVVSIWHTRDDGLITDYRVFFDLTPVYAP